jgi:hypothetical protein
MTGRRPVVRSHGMQHDADGPDQSTLANRCPLGRTPVPSGSGSLRRACVLAVLVSCSLSVHDRLSLRLDEPACSRFKLRYRRLARSCK